MKKSLPRAKSRGFTLVELLVVITIIGILASIGLSTFTSAQAKGRDAKRKAHLRQVADALEAYYNDYRQYPADDNGQMKACGTDALTTCSWGTSAMENNKGTVYMVKLPQDPSSNLTYFYTTQQVNNKYTKYQLYARLENTKDPSSVYPKIYPGTDCNSTATVLACNYGISSTNSTLATPQ